MSGSKYGDLILTQNFLKACTEAKGSLPGSLAREEDQVMFQQLQESLQTTPRTQIFCESMRKDRAVERVPLLQLEAKSSGKTGEWRFTVQVKELGSGAFGKVSALDVVIKTNAAYEVQDITTTKKAVKDFFDKDIARNNETALEEYKLQKALVREQRTKVE